MCANHSKLWSSVFTAPGAGRGTPSDGSCDNFPDYFLLRPAAPHPRWIGWSMAQLEAALTRFDEKTQRDADQTLRALCPWLAHLQEGQLRALALHALQQSAPFPLTVASSLAALADAPHPAQAKDSEAAAVACEAAGKPLVIYVTSPHDPDMHGSRVVFDSARRVGIQLQSGRRESSRQQGASPATGSPARL